MKKFIEKPNLPQAKVRLALISPQIQKNAVLELERRGIELVYIRPCASLAEPVMYHADILVHHKGGREVILAPSQREISTYLERVNISVLTLSDDPKADYPLDVPLNCCVFGKNVICNINHVSRMLLDFYEKSGYKIINTKQGYAKCSSLVINENSIVTDDESIHRACESAGIDVLLIGKGNISLPGYPYGFIGGSGGLIDKNTLAFFGDFRTHPDAPKLEAFLRLHAVRPLNLCEGKLSDLGGIIPLIEEDEK